MYIPTQASTAIEVQTANPWVFAEEVAFGERRYLLRWTIKGHYLACVEAHDLEGDAAEDVPPDARPTFAATVKWDGCADWRLGDDGYVHTCIAEAVVAFAGAMAYVHSQGGSVLSAREEIQIRSSATLWD